MRRKPVVVIELVLAWGFLVLFILVNGDEAAAFTITLVPETPIQGSPTYDPLATPVLSTNPSESELGGYLYYFHCMPCHGDLGQGLTDEFRQVWVEDHQNCWEKGCHGGNPQDEGFPIPTIIPAIITDEDALIKYIDFEPLINYLHDTHPPQEPGRLDEKDYRAIAIYLWMGNHKPVDKLTQAAVSVSVSPNLFKLPAATTVTPTITNPPTPTITSMISASTKTPISTFIGTNYNNQQTFNQTLIAAGVTIIGLIIGIYLTRLWKSKPSDN